MPVVTPSETNPGNLQHALANKVEDVLMQSTAHFSTHGHNKALEAF